MSDDSSQDKKHDATSKRLSELSQKGNVMRSRDLTSGLVFVVTIMQIMYMVSRLKEQIVANFTLSFDAIQKILVNHDNISGIFKKIVTDNFLMLIPIFCLAFIVVLLSPFIFGGWNFTLQPIQFKFDKLNPINNLKKMFAPVHMAMEIFKSMLKSFFIMGVMITFVVVKKDSFIKLLNNSAESAIAASYSIVVQFIVVLTFTLVAFVAFDIIYNYFKFKKDIKMTTQEVEDEHKAMEGNQQIKARIRQRQIALLRQTLNKTVPLANVIITNPTHYSIALKYDEHKDHAPKVIAKGTGDIASRIRTIAIANGVPIYEAPALARSIYHTTKIGFDIHPGLYKAVAAVLSYVYQLKIINLVEVQHRSL